MTEAACFDALVARVLATPGRYLDPPRLAAILDMPMPQLAWLSRVDLETLSQHPQASLVQERLTETVHVIAKATDICEGHRKSAVSWFKTASIPGLGGKTAEHYVAEGNVEAVMFHLLVAENGGFA